MAEQPTPLAIALGDDAGRERPTPLTAFKLGRRWWIDGKRLNLSALATELGVGRATLMRWVGNKELFLGEILWSLYKDVFDTAVENADRKVELRGVDYLVHIYDEINRVLTGSEPFQRFLQQDPEFALKVLTSGRSGMQQRLIGVWKALFDEQIAAGAIAPQMDSYNLAYFIVRIGEGVVYSDLICGREPTLEPASKAFRLLLTSAPGG